MKHWSHAKSVAEKKSIIKVQKEVDGGPSSTKMIALKESAVIAKPITYRATNFVVSVTQQLSLFQLSNFAFCTLSCNERNFVMQFLIIITTNTVLIANVL